MAGEPSRKMEAPLPHWKSFACSASAACVAEALTIPIDTAKVRLQLQTASGNVTAPKYRGMFGTLATVTREEGVLALWKGLSPGLHRQCLVGGLRVTMYDPIKAHFVGGRPDEAPLHIKVAAGMSTGAIAIAIASPTDLVKVRMQAEGKLPVGAPRRYPSALAAYRIIARQEGVAGLWTGLVPNVTRVAIITAAELAAYDEVKEQLVVKAGMADGVACHLLSGLGAGLFGTIFGSPIDVVKSRVMGGKYNGMIDCFIKTLASDGPVAFYKGFIPNFSRMASWNVAMFMTLEQARRLARSFEDSSKQQNCA